MKKELLLVSMAVIALGTVTWFLVQDSHVNVYVDFNFATSDSQIEQIKEQFKTSTHNKLIMACTMGTAISCHGSYGANNFVELIRFQNNLFEIAATNNLTFSSFVNGPFLAKWLD